MAKGSNSAHSNRRRPGKLHMVTSQAVPTPIITDRLPTPASSSSVVLIYTGRMVSTRCGQMFSLGNSASQNTASTGSITSNALPQATVYQPGMKRRGLRVSISGAAAVAVISVMTCSGAQKR